MVLSQALSVSIFVTALTTAQRYSNVTGQARSDVFRIEGDRNTGDDELLPRHAVRGLRRVHRELHERADGPRAGRDRAARGVDGRLRVGDDRRSRRAAARPPGRSASSAPGTSSCSTSTSATAARSPRADERAAPPVPVVVLSDALNRQLYGGADSVGRTIRIAGRDFRVAGRDAPAARQAAPVGLRRLAREHGQPDGAVRVRRRAAPAARVHLAAAAARARLARDRRVGRAGSPSTGCGLPSADARTRFAAALPP